MLTVKVVQVFGQQKTFNLKRRGIMEKTVRLLKCWLPIMILLISFVFSCDGLCRGRKPVPPRI